MKQKIPLRRCVVTREQFPKRELIRIVRNKEGLVSVDLTGKANGRGAYVQKDPEVIAQAQKRKVLERQLEVSIPQEVYDELTEIAQAFQKEK
ncbi:MAG: RNase P modulator RnpM [Culicoidibacterales bacterium]